MIAIKYFSSCIAVGSTYQFFCTPFVYRFEFCNNTRNRRCLYIYIT